MIETDADRLAMMTILGETVTIDGVSVSAVFENEYSRVGVLYSTSDPVVTCRASDVPAVVRGSSVLVRGNAYRVRDIQPDGTGVTVLQLERS